MLDLIRHHIARYAYIAKVAYKAGAIAIPRPSKMVELARSALQTSSLGPHLALMAHAAAHPDKEALIEYGEHGVSRFTYGELDATINRLAGALVTRGLAKGGRVAMMLPNGKEYLIAQQALARIGGTAVQLGYRSKAGEIAYILDNADPVATIVHASFLPTMRDARSQSGKGGALIVVDGENVTDAGTTERAIDWDRALAASSPEMPKLERGGDGGGVIVYTSGTTGKPKGANRSWKSTGFDSVADLIDRVGMRADDRHLVVCPLYHSAAPAFVAIMMGLGATIVLMNHFDPEGALDIIAKERITCSVMVPTMLIRIANLPPETIAKHDASSLRWIMSAAAPLTTDAARRFMDKFGPVQWNFYGATETGLVTIAGPHDHLSRPGTIGVAMRGNEIRLLGDDGRQVKQGEIGELYVKNETMITGYHNNSDATTDAQKQGLFSVGDLARQDADGYYFLESRKHDMVISGGVNIYPREIEDVLATHPAILEAAIVGVPHPEWGESLKAFVVLRPGHDLTGDDVIKFARQHLADFKSPRAVSFLPEMPRNPTGKILKRELRDL
ncbi:MAG TPA: AMP-binding protein [Kofleriaceae bacterium]